MEEQHEHSKKDINDKSILENMRTVNSDDKVATDPKEHPPMLHGDSKQKSTESQDKVHEQTDENKLHQKSNSKNNLKSFEESNPVKEKDHLRQESLVKEPSNLNQQSQEIEPVQNLNHKSDEVFSKPEQSKPDPEVKKILQNQEEEIAKEFREDNDDTSRGNSFVHAYDRQKPIKVHDEEVNELDQITSTDLLEKQSMSLNQLKKAVAKGQMPRKLSQGAHQRPQFSMNGLILAKMSEYDGLRDYNLQPFFGNEYRRRVLIKNGLITDDGYIVRNPEEYLKKKEIYTKTNCYPEEASNIRAHTLDKKKFNPYKENAMRKTKPIQSKPKDVTKSKPAPLAKQEANKAVRK